MNRTDVFKNMNLKQLDIIMEIAREMTKVGAEISRIEESVTRMCLAYDIESCEVYAITSQLVVSIKTKDGEYLTLHKRIGTTGTDIERLDKLNALVRHVSNTAPSIEKIEKLLKETEMAKRANKKILPVFYGVIAAAFSLFFGSRSFAEIGFSFVIGFIVGIIAVIFETVNLNKILARFLCSLSASLLVTLLLSLRFITNPDYVIIGNIMSLIPGIGLTNALRDLFCGDMITGILRSIEALLLTVAIALGFALPTLLMGGII